MTLFSKYRFPPFKEWQDFEDLCCDLWKNEWKYPDTQKNGRRGQKQKGVDIFGKADDKWSGIQCKTKDYNKSLSEDEIKKEVSEALNFQPPLSKLIIATTAPNDTGAQKVARKITDEHAKKDLFSVSIYSWDSILEVLSKYPEIQKKHFSIFFDQSETIPLLQIENPKEAIQQLAEYEIDFLKKNTSFLKMLQVSTDKKDSPEGWKEYVHKSKGNGLLRLASDKSSLQWFIEKITQNKVRITSWLRYLGEKTITNEEIAIFTFDQGIENEFLHHINLIFECFEEENEAHVQVDQYLRGLESRILSDVKSNKIQDAKDGLMDFLEARRTYSSFKKDLPDAFYPNTRYLGRIPVFGWDFIYLWNEVLKNICDIVFSNQYPKSVYDLLINVPFHLCMETILYKRPKKSIQIDLDTLGVVFWVISEKSDAYFMTNFLDKLEDLAQRVKDLDHEIKTISDAELAVDISKEIAVYIANLGYLTLSGKVVLPFNEISKLLSLATSLHFSYLLSGKEAEGHDWQYIDNTRKEFSHTIHIVMKEYLFAWATFAWHQERAKSVKGPDFAISLLKHLETRDTVLFYSQNKGRMDGSGWLDFWFRPEGKRVGWSWSLDHDVRDSLQLAILTLPIKMEDFEKLNFLEVKSSYEEFVKEITNLHELLKIKNVKINELSIVQSVLEEAHNYHQKKLTNLISNQKTFLLEKIEEINSSFLKYVLERSQEGDLYTVEETLQSLGLTPTHYTGIRCLYEKIWFLEDTGYSSYTVNGLGRHWAEALTNGRTHLIVDKARELSTKTTYNSNSFFEMLEQIRNEYNENHILLYHPATVPWDTFSKLCLNEHQVIAKGESKKNGRSGKLAKIDIYHTRSLKLGELLIVPKMAFSWVINERIQAPKINLIDEDSEEGKKLKEKNSEINLGVKVIVDASESGTMIYKEGIEKPLMFVPDKALVEPLE